MTGREDAVVKDNWTAAFERGPKPFEAGEASVPEQWDYLKRAEEIKQRRIAAHEQQMLQVPRWRRWLARMRPWRGGCGYCWGEMKPWSPSGPMHVPTYRVCDDCKLCVFIGSDY